MAKKAILAIIIIILIASVFALCLSYQESVDIYIDGENVSVSTQTLNFKINTNNLNSEICDYTIDALNDTTSNVSTLRSGINDICRSYGLEEPEININSSIGENQIPVLVYVDGTSMVPTLKDGQNVLVNKTKNIHVGDIVVANSDEYGGIIKRVDDIQGNCIHLVSDNKDIDYKYVNGSLYEVKGVSTWVDISDIGGVAIRY